MVGSPLKKQRAGPLDGLSKQVIAPAQASTSAPSASASHIDKNAMDEEEEL